MKVIDLASPMSADHRRWYVLQCKPRQDFRAREHLQRQGFSCYLPMRSIEKLHRGRKIEAHEPLFPRYLFIRLDEINDNWSPIRSTCGVARIVRFNGNPAPVNDYLIDAIRRLASNRPAPYLQAGDRVRITAGCFSNVEAIFLTNDGSERVMVLMNILQREQTLSFPLAIVRKHSGL